MALARVCLFNENRHSNLPMYKVGGNGRKKERTRFERAVSIVEKNLNTIIADVKEKIGEPEANIFLAQRMILTDNGLGEQISHAILKEGHNAEVAVTQVLDSYEDKISAMDNQYIKERATDIGEVKRRVLDVLRNMNPSLQCGDEQHCQRGKGRIIIAEELTPRLTMELDTEHTLGFITEKGGAGSHAAILARSLGIPAISGISNIHSKVLCGTEVLLDGDGGTVFIWPSDQTLNRYPSLRVHEKKTPDIIPPLQEFSVMGSISRSHEADSAAEMLADGIGLYRTEFEFLAENRLLTEDEQTERYSSVVRKMEGKPVFLRLLDIGGDKDAPFLNLPAEENPYLGLRGSRLLLAQPELLLTQARAIVRASEHGQIHVLYPMIINLDQFIKLRKAFADAVQDLNATNILHGVMFEVPSACFEAEAILNEADFASIGSNDLIQYLFAVDRNNELVAGDYRPDHEAFWQVMDMLGRAAAKTGKPISLCGELAGYPQHMEQLVKYGLTSVSVSSRLISGVRIAAAKHLQSIQEPEK